MFIKNNFYPLSCNLALEGELSFKIRVSCNVKDPDVEVSWTFLVPERISEEQSFFPTWGSEKVHFLLDAILLAISSLLEKGCECIFLMINWLRREGKSPKFAVFIKRNCNHIDRSKHSLVLGRNTLYTRHFSQLHASHYQENHPMYFRLLCFKRCNMTVKLMLIPPGRVSENHLTGMKMQQD